MQLFQFLFIELLFKSIFIRLFFFVHLCPCGLLEGGGGGVSAHNTARSLSHQARGGMPN